MRYQASFRQNNSTQVSKMPLYGSILSIIPVIHTDLTL